MQTRAVLASLAVALGGCAGADALAPEQHAPPPERAAVTSVEVAELEISHDGVDRFTSCPPGGELGQDWIPRVPPWSLPPRSADAQPLAPVDPLPPAEPPPDGGARRTPTEKAVTDTFAAFRHCHERALRHDPTQNGHAAIVLRVGAEGRVVAAETYGACELSHEAVACMTGAAAKLRFEPPAGGTATITIPAVFAARGGHASAPPSPNDAYTASAYLTVEGARADLHACDAAARRSGQDLAASATFLLDLDGEGRVVHVHVDPWQGNQELLGCAAHTVERLVFARPPAGRGSVLARVSFNPRLGTK
jgi:hypothetical protein